MERRAFLALLASAPIAALAPLPKVLEHSPTIISNATGARTFFVTSGGDGYLYQIDDASTHVWSLGDIADRAFAGLPLVDDPHYQQRVREGLAALKRNGY